MKKQVRLYIKALYKIAKIAKYVLDVLKNLFDFIG